MISPPLLRYTVVRGKQDTGMDFVSADVELVKDLFEDNAAP